MRESIKTENDRALPRMRIDIMTLFPDTMRAVLGESILGRAAQKDIIEINCVQIRDFTENKQGQVDDYTYGGGWGCVMMAQPLKSCLDFVKDCAAPENRRTRVIYMSPQGQRFDQSKARQLKEDYDHLILVCGHYEGIDERFIEECVDEELSVGDFVLTGGEIPAMAVTDCVCRMIPGVLSDEECFTGESHWEGLLEYPQYTRPEVWEGREVPEILRTGHHANIEKWRRKQSIIRTRERRPDMYQALDMSSKADKKLLREIERDAQFAAMDVALTTRLAKVSDLDTIMQIVFDAQTYMREQGINQWQNGKPCRQQFAEDISRGECFLLCEGEAVACMVTLMTEPDPNYGVVYGGRWLTDGESYAVIHRCAVAKAYRGKCVSRVMMERMEAIARELGCKSMRIDTHRDNRAMRGLLNSMGYFYCGVIHIDEPAPGDIERAAFEKLLGE